jgi:DNA helicase II / ATP-dependent DNA helicase PcrA
LIWSPYQRDIFRYMSEGGGNRIVRAVAGSGKTSTIIHGLHNTPSDSVVLAFNKAVADELARRVPEGVTVATMHSLAFRALRRAAGSLKVIDNTRKIAKNLAGEMNVPLARRAEIITDACAMVSRAKNLGIGILLPDQEPTWRDIALSLDAADDRDLKAFASALLKATREAAEKTLEISFDDMLWLALLHDVAMPRFDTVAIDEAQDLNGAQRAILGRLLAAGGRLIAVGDPMQAIYAFRGADAQSFARVHSEFNCRELPLTISYRCSKAVVEFAREIVPYLEPFHAAPQGEVVEDFRPKWTDLIPGEDVILCRCNAPLIRLALSLVSLGIGVKIAGRDFACGLRKLVARFKGTSIGRLRVELNDWRDREVVRLLNADRQEEIESVEDRHDCLAAVMDALSPGASAQDLDDRLEYLFNDRNGVLELSSLHRSKGREWQRVFILRPGLMPAKWAKSAEARAQEVNLQYVAYTRAKFGLYLLDDEIQRAK